MKEKLEAMLKECHVKIKENEKKMHDAIRSGDELAIEHFTENVSYLQGRFFTLRQVLEMVK